MGVSNENFEFVEQTVPAGLVALAVFFVGQLLVDQRELRAAVDGLKQERHQRLVFGYLAPLPGEHERYAARG